MEKDEELILCFYEDPGHWTLQVKVRGFILTSYENNELMLSYLKTLLEIDKFIKSEHIKEYRDYVLLQNKLSVKEEVKVKKVSKI